MLFHYRDSTKSTNVGVVQCTTVVEIESHRGILKIVASEVAVVNQKRAGKSWLHYESVAAVEIDDHELRASPAAHDLSAAQALIQGARSHLPQHILLAHGDLLDFSPADR